MLKNKNEYQTYLNDENKEEKAPIYKFVQKVCRLDPPKLNDILWCPNSFCHAHPLALHTHCRQSPVISLGNQFVKFYHATIYLKYW